MRLLDATNTDIVGAPAHLLSPTVAIIICAVAIAIRAVATAVGAVATAVGATIIRVEPALPIK